VGTASKRDVLDGRLTPARIRLVRVMELEEAVLGATAAIARDERTSAPIALPYLSLDLRRHMTGPRLRAPARARVRRRRELPLLDLPKQQGKGTHEDRAGIAVRDLATQQVLQASELLLGVLADRELHA
jgi:hypothetical protein